LRLSGLKSFEFNHVKNYFILSTVTKPLPAVPDVALVDDEAAPPVPPPIDELPVIQEVPVHPPVPPKIPVFPLAKPAVLPPLPPPVPGDTDGSFPCEPPPVIARHGSNRESNPKDIAFVAEPEAAPVR
jgi:hypothetical protein